MIISYIIENEQKCDENLPHLQLLPPYYLWRCGNICAEALRGIDTTRF